MEAVLTRRQEIYDYFQNSESCQQFFLDAAKEERHAAYYTSMYLLQDTTESLIAHRERGFSSDPFEAYIEFWGVMQALIIQQDSIAELCKAVTGKALKTHALNSWKKLRDFRNTCAGHPAKRDRNLPLTRTFMGRGFGGYSSITYEQWQAQGGTTHPEVNLGELIDNYAIEAEPKLEEILESMREQWP